MRGCRTTTRDMTVNGRLGTYMEEHPVSGPLYLILVYACPSPVLPCKGKTDLGTTQGSPVALLSFSQFAITLQAVTIIFFPSDYKYNVTFHYKPYMGRGKYGSWQSIYFRGLCRGAWLVVRDERGATLEAKHHGRAGSHHLLDVHARHHAPRLIQCSFQAVHIENGRVLLYKPVCMRTPIYTGIQSGMRCRFLLMPCNEGASDDQQLIRHYQGRRFWPTPNERLLPIYVDVWQ